MPPVFTTKKIGIQGGRKKKVKYYRNKKGLLRARSECEMWAGKLVGLVSTIADIHTIIIQVLRPEPYKTNFSSFSFLLFFFLPFCSSFVALLSRGVAAMDSSWVHGGHGALGGVVGGGTDATGMEQT
jgi:hypothetical protein